MDRDFLDYYNRELVFLRDMGRQFSDANPGVAELLELTADGSEDPHVERLIQAFAFLAARIRKKLDDEYPEITSALLSVIFPHYLRPVPSMTIVQFSGSSDPTKAVAGQTIPRGTKLKSLVAIEGVRCHFQTSYPVTLWPIIVESAGLIPDRVVQTGKPSGAVSLIKLVLKCSAPGGWKGLQGLKSLRFFLGGNEPIPSVLYECLFSRVCEVWIQGKSSSGAAFRKVLPRRSVMRVGFEAGEHLDASASHGELGSGEPGRVGFEPDEQLYPFPECSFPGYRLLQDFFSFPAKYLFFDLQLSDPGQASNNVLSSSELDGPVELLFWLDQAPRHELVVRAENFRLGCTPAANLFRLTAEPIAWNQLQTEYQIVPDADHPTAYEIYSVDRVVSSGSYLDQGATFEPFYALRHLACEPHNPAMSSARKRQDVQAEERTAYWFATRQPSMRDEEGTEVVLSFTNSRFKPSSPAVEKITTFLTCSNRDLPPKLPFGGDQGYLEPEAEMAVGLARMLTKPSEPLRPPLGRSAQWRLISQLGLNHLSLVPNQKGVEALRESLTLYDFARTAMTRKMIEGILEVSHARIAGRVVFPESTDGGSSSEERMRKQRLKGKPLSFGIEIRLRFDEDAYSGGMAYILASVLDRFLGAYASINSFTQLVATSKQREVNWKWPARSGDRTLL
jgi:type VI secretion system protein ImpG